MDTAESSFNDMQRVKREFFAMRNGVIADSLRKAGSPFRIIFGLNLPQLADIASHTPHDRALAERLWLNSTTRESMMLAPMLVSPDGFDAGDARRWIASVVTREVADVLCLKLLRHVPYALDLAFELLDEVDNPMTRYVGLRLMFNLVNRFPQPALQSAEAILASTDPDRTVRQVASMLRDEARFILGLE